jgi:hypothetical protein
VSRYGYKQEHAIILPDDAVRAIHTIWDDEIEASEVLGELIWAAQDAYSQSKAHKDWMYLAHYEEFWTRGWYEITDGYPNEFGRHTIKELEQELQRPGTHLLLVVTDVRVEFVTCTWFGED